jgi:crotonobetaine/carnitine-CoA ligase
MKKAALAWPTLGHLLEDAAKRHREKTLLVYEGQTLSFEAFDLQVNRAANALQALAVGRGDKVALMLPNGFEFPTAWLASAKLGAVMVPVNINYKEHDLEYILNDSEASAIVIAAEFLPVLAKVRSRLPLLKHLIVVGLAVEGFSSYATLLAEADDRFTISGVGENDLLNIQYTSGTTGFPKGCMLTHRYWLAMGRTASEFCPFYPTDVDLTAQPFYYMDPQWNLILCLMHGIPLVVMHRFSPSKFWQAVRDNGVTFFYVIGTMPFYLLKQDPDPELEQRHKLRLAICSGIVPQFHAQFEKRWNVPWREAFGMTETGGDLMVPLDDAESVGSGALGRPFSTKEARVVGADMVEVADGEVGELVVRGEPMMLGYWKKPEATAAAMAGGWMHTGDLAYKDPKGYFHWVGRLKDMVRRSGENISSVEVEGVLMEHPQIKLAAVVAVPDELRGEEVKAHIVLQPGVTPGDCTPEAILAWAGEKLAYFKLPRYIEYVSDLPRTPSEKVAKHELIKARKDLREGSYDAVEKTWR